MASKPKWICTFQCQDHPEHVFSKKIEEGSLDWQLAHAGGYPCSKCKDGVPGIANLKDKQPA